MNQYPMLLSGGMWGTIELTYDESEVHSKKIRPFKVVSFTPFQIIVINLNEFIEKRSQFTTDEWIDILVNSCGLDPEPLNRRQKLLYVCRCVPLAENNVNQIELAPRETGKTYLYRNVSYYAHVLSGGKATPAQLFINLNTGKIGEVGTRDAAVFDEIANTDFTEPKTMVSIMQGYMQEAKFSGARRSCWPSPAWCWWGTSTCRGRSMHGDNERVHLLWMKITAYEGPAGTGKTTKLIQSLEGLLASEPLRDGQRVLALTFMHGSRRRLHDRLSKLTGLRGRLECTTFDSFAFMVCNRWKSLLKRLGLSLPGDGEFDKTCDCCGALLEQAHARSWIARGFPTVVVDEAQDLSLERLRIVKGLAPDSNLLVAADEFQCLNDKLIHSHPIGIKRSEAGWVEKCVGQFVLTLPLSRDEN